MTAAKKGTKTAATKPAAPVKVTGAAATKATVAHVHDEGGHIRTYSKEVHGTTFLDHAKEFAGKKQGRKVVAE